MEYDCYFLTTKEGFPSTLESTGKRKFNLPFVNIAEMFEIPFENRKRFQRHARAQIFTDYIHFTEIGNAFQAHLIGPPILKELGLK